MHFIVSAATFASRSLLSPEESFRSQAQMLTFMCSFEVAVKLFVYMYVIEAFSFDFGLCTWSLHCFVTSEFHHGRPKQTPTIHRSAQRLSRLRCKYSACLIRDVDSCVGKVYNDRARAQKGEYGCHDRPAHSALCEDAVVGVWAHRFVCVRVCARRSERVGCALRSKLS
jgi:hypothetical protein